MSYGFCGQCGVQATGGNFCRNCGAPLATSPAQPQYPSTPVAPMVNPFAGIPLTDFARDIAALVLLFGALSLPWDSLEDGSGRWWVVISTIISALSIGIPYLVKLNVIAGWGAAQSRLVKFACSTPYLVSVLAVVINELIHLNDLGEGAIGAGVGVGLAGALIAAQARACDEEPTGAADAAWRTTLFVVLGGGIAIVALTTLIELATTLSETDEVTALLGVMLLLLTSFAIVVALPFIGFLNGGREWGRVLAVAGFALIATQFFGSSGEDDPLFQALLLERVKDVIGVFLVAAGIALLVSRPIQRRLNAMPAIPSWVQTARNACTVLAVALTLSAVGRLLILVGIEEIDGTGIVTLVLLVVAAAAAVLASALLAGDPDQARKVVVALLGGIVLLAIVEIAVGRSGLYYGAVTPAEVVGWFAMPGLVLFSLLVPAEIRSTFQPIAAAPPGNQPPPPQA